MTPESTRDPASLGHYNGTCQPDRSLRFLLSGRCAFELRMIGLPTSIVRPYHSGSGASDDADAQMR
jgi:hypothetical protein